MANRLETGMANVEHKVEMRGKHGIVVDSKGRIFVGKIISIQEYADCIRVTLKEAMEFKNCRSKDQEYFDCIFENYSPQFDESFRFTPICECIDVFRADRIVSLLDSWWVHISEVEKGEDVY